MKPPRKLGFLPQRALQPFLLAAVFLALASLVLRADIACYESVEWMTARSDRIGIYKVAKIQGPIKVTEVAPGGTQSGYPYSTAEFRLEKSLRGNPPAVFSRTRSLEKPELLGFKTDNTYIFFFAAGENPPVVPVRNDTAYEKLFAMWDYVWLERPVGERNGPAIDHTGKVLTDQADIFKAVVAALSLASAHLDIVDRSAYFYRDNKTLYPTGKDFNFETIAFPTRNTSELERKWTENNSATLLIVHVAQYDKTLSRQ